MAIGMEYALRRSRRDLISVLVRSEHRFEPGVISELLGSYGDIDEDETFSDMLSGADLGSPR